MGGGSGLLLQQSVEEVGNCTVVWRLARPELRALESAVDSGRPGEAALGSLEDRLGGVEVGGEGRGGHTLLEQEGRKSRQEVLLRFRNNFNILARCLVALSSSKGRFDDLAKALLWAELEEVLVKDGDLGVRVPAGRYEECVALDHQRRCLQGEVVAGVDEVLVQQVAVLVLLDAGVEETRSVGKAELPHGLKAAR